MKPDNWTLVRGARQLLTLHYRGGARRGRELADLGLIVDGSVLLRNGMVEAVGPTRRIENLSGSRKAEEINAAGRVVMPAFVDAHACLVPVPGCRHESSRSVQALPATRLEAQADRLVKIMARHGTATIGALSGYGGDSSGELKILRVLRTLNRKPLDIVAILCPLFTGDQASELNLELLDCAARRKLAQVVSVRCGDGGVSREAAESYLTAARSLGLAVRVEMLPQRDFQLVETAVNLQALAVVTPGIYRLPEIELLAGSSTFAILLPQIGARLEPGGIRLAESAREMIDHGVLIALGSGLNPESGSTASMQSVVQMACEVLGLSLAEAISAATINAAWALGVGRRSGSLEHGKQGDLLLLNASDYRDIGFVTGTNLVHSMMKRGVVLFKEDFPGWPSEPD